MQIHLFVQITYRQSKETFYSLINNLELNLDLIVARIPNLVVVFVDLKA